MNNVFEELERLKNTIKSTTFIKQNISGNISGNIDINNFIQNYRYGLISNEQLKQKLFHKIDGISFDKCLKAAQTGGAICENNTNEQNFCPYMGYESNTCYIGGSINDSQNFNNNTGIPVYATPLNSNEDIKIREKKTMESIKLRLINNKKKIDNQILDINTYIRALELNKSFDYAKDIITDEKNNLNKNLKTKKLNKNVIDLKQHLQIIKDKYKNITELAEEKIKLANMEEQTIREKDNKLNYLDNSLNLLKQKIINNDYLYNINDTIIYYLKFSSIILFVITLIISIFFLKK